MNSDDSSMYDDPSTPAYVRDLLQAGRRANSGYDIERGLAKHLAAIAATAPAAHWAPAASAAKIGLPAWFGYVAMPLAAAGVAGLLWWYSADHRAPAEGATSISGSAPAPSEAADVAVAAAVGGVRTPSSSPAAVVAAPSVAAHRSSADDSEARGSDDSRQASALERRRSGVRSNAAHGTNIGSRGGRPSLGTRASDGDLNGVAAVTGDGSATETRENKANDVSTRNAAKDSSAASESRTQAVDSNAAEAERAAPEAAAEAASPKANAKPAPIVDESRLEREMQMLAVTQRVLATDPGRALRLAEQGEREFAASMFSAERRQLGLLALVKLGRLDEARRAGRPFLARYPKAPWSERLRRALATGVVD
jgi:hypothetical protein